VAERDTRSRLLRRAAKANLFIPDSQADQLAAFLELLFRWNRKINLTALTSVDEGIDRLLLEPWMASRYLPPGTGALIDVGSGGGSPAIPMAIALPDYRLTMVEVKARKAAFLREAVRALGLPAATVEAARFEELLPRESHRGIYTALTARAVRLDRLTLSELSGFLAKEGLVLVFRGRSGSDVAPDAPPLVFVATHPLVAQLGSRITIYRHQSVPRGTSAT
jgi:16S rRNA (guanine527-N7)-methyltransferase